VARLSAQQKDAQLRLLRNLLDAAKIAKVQVWLIGGSLLGAVRDGGMIAWDDDIDIGILRDEYPKLIKQLMNIPASKQIAIHDWDTDNDYPYVGFAKLVDQNAGLKQNQLNKYNQNISIDIFPFDRQTKNFKRLQWIKVKFYNTTLLQRRDDSRIHGSLIKSILAQLISLLATRQDTNALIAKQKKAIRQKPLSTNLINFGSGYRYGREILYPSEIRKLDYASFDGVRAPIPSGAQSILARQFGSLKPIDTNRHG
jgi:lipopolysaccharide cholinephosphotransferase